MRKALDWRRDGATWPGHANSRFVRAGGIDWHVQVSGAGPVALLLHGTGASTHSWRGLAPLLAARFTVIAPDLPGHAFTRVPDGLALSLPAMARSVTALMAELGQRPDIVIGHSAGAAVAMQMALDGATPPRGIVSLNGALRPLEGFASRFFPPVARLLALLPIVPNMFAWRARDPAVVDDLLRQTGSHIGDEDRARYHRLATTPSHVGAALSMMANWEVRGLEAAMARLALPVLLVAGTEDGMVPASEAVIVARKLAHGEVAKLKGLGHLAHEEQPERVAAVIAAWIDRALPARTDVTPSLGAAAL
jgi:magnesium chelatase accessory protein